MCLALVLSSAAQRSARRESLVIGSVGKNNSSLPSSFVNSLKQTSSTLCLLTAGGEGGGAEAARCSLLCLICVRGRTVSAGDPVKVMDRRQTLSQPVAGATHHCEILTKNLVFALRRELACFGRDFVHPSSKCFPHNGLMYDVWSTPQSQSPRVYGLHFACFA